MTTLLVAGLALVGAAPANAAAGDPPAPVSGAPSSPSGFTEWNGLLYFSAVAEGDVYSSLFSYDGTTFTQILSSPVGPTQLHAFGDELIFEAIPDINALPSYIYALYSYDGTTITQVPGAFESPNDFVTVGDTVYFQASVAGSLQLWQYDGTATAAVAGGAVAPTRLSEFGGKVYFEGGVDPFRVLYSYDPATPATPAAPVAGSPIGADEVVAYDGTGYLGTGSGLYRFDGTTFTPVDTPADAVGGLTVFDGALYFTGYAGGFGAVYYYRDGVTTAVAGTVTETGSYVDYKGVLYFLGFSGGQPVLVGIANGVATAVPGSPPYPFEMTVFQGKLYFQADGADGFPAMYVYEGPGPMLAPTGVDAAAIVMLALALLGAGAVVLVARRRVTAA